MSDYDQHRRFLLECLELAQVAHTPGARAVLVQMAQAWFRLAEERAKRREP
jgi:hypothetical protein